MIFVQAILQRILMHTQQQVIDVSNMDGGAFPSTHYDFTQRMQRYDAALKRADPAKYRAHIVRISPAAADVPRGSMSSAAAGGSPPMGAIVTQPTTYGSMDDVGAQVADILAQPAVSQTVSARGR